jgi:hypothetical protein
MLDPDAEVLRAWMLKQSTQLPDGRSVPSFNSAHYIRDDRFKPFNVKELQEMILEVAWQVHDIWSGHDAA